MVTFFSSVVSPVFTAITLVVRVPVDSTLTRPMSPALPADRQPRAFQSILIKRACIRCYDGLKREGLALYQVNTRRLHLYAVGRRRISRSHRRREHCPQQNTGKEEGKHPYPHLLFHGKSLLCSLESRGRAGSARPLLSNMIRGYVVGESPSIAPCVMTKRPFVRNCPVPPASVT